MLHHLNKKKFYLLKFFLPLLGGIFLILKFNLDQQVFCCDIVSYLRISKIFNEFGLWHHHNLSHLRTYLFPFILSFIYSNDFSVLSNFLMHVLYAFIFTFFAIFQFLKSAAIKNYFLIIVAFLLNPFLLIYLPIPLSESLTLLIFYFYLGYFIWGINKFKLTRTIKKSFPFLFNFLALGIFSGLLQVTRPANITLATSSILLLFLAPLIKLRYLEKETKPSKNKHLSKIDWGWPLSFSVLLVALFSLGFLIAVLPQIIINFKHYQIFSFFPAYDLGGYQLYEGLQNYKYATFYNLNTEGERVFYPTTELVGRISSYANRPYLFYLFNPHKGIILFISHIYQSVNFDFFYPYITSKRYSIFSWHQISSSLITISGILGVLFRFKHFKKEILLRLEHLFLLTSLFIICFFNGLLSVEIRFGMIPFGILTYFGLLFFIRDYKLLSKIKKSLCLFIIASYVLSSIYVSMKFVALTGKFKIQWF